jgi:hypothetical protein
MTEDETAFVVPDIPEVAVPVAVLVRHDVARTHAV